MSAPLRRSGNPLQSHNNKDDVTPMRNNWWRQSNAQHWPEFLDLKTQTGGQDPRFLCHRFQKMFHLLFYVLFPSTVSTTYLVDVFLANTYNSLSVILLLCTTLALERKLKNSSVVIISTRRSREERGVRFNNKLAVLFVSQIHRKPLFRSQVNI